MNRKAILSLMFAFALVALSIVVGACEKKSDQPPTPPAAAKTEPKKPVEPLIKKQEIADWCPEHGVPESICTRCNASLIEGFKAKGDWCKEHDLPESQCFKCHPELEAKFKAMAPKGS